MQAGGVRIIERIRETIWDILKKKAETIANPAPVPKYYVRGKWGMVIFKSCLSIHGARNRTFIHNK
jgi:hypothetical protein